MRGFILIPLLAAGCAESFWKVPYPPGERPSILWSRDSRTTGWDGVDVEYALCGAGDVDATVRSGDGWHQFSEHGRYWYENEHGDRPESYKEQAYLVVRFDGREERYRFVHHPGVDRGCISVVAPDGNRN